MKYSDKELVNLLKKGDNDAFCQMVKKYNSRLSGTIYSIIKDEDKTKDLLQEVFIKVYKSINLFRGDSSLITWMTRIAVNYSINFFKKHKKKISKEVHLKYYEDNDEQTQSFFEATIMKDEDNLPEKLFLKEEEKEYINSALDSLDENHKLVLRLKYYDNFSTREISHILGKPEGTVRSRLFYARNELKDKLSVI